MTLDRRTVLAMLGAGVPTLAALPADYRLHFFSREENDVLDRVAEMILPATERSPGASAARVSLYLDLVVSRSPAETQRNWRRRLQAFDQLGRPFLSLDPAAQAARLDQVAVGERAPSTDAERFFADVKRLTLFAYYTTSIGLLRELGYKGNQAAHSFPGCPHPPKTHG